MLPLPPRPTLFPYTTLFRSGAVEPALLHAPTGRVMRADRIVRAQRAHAQGMREVVLEVPTLLDQATECAVGVRTPGVQERSEEHTSELQSLTNLVCRLLLEK